MTFFRVIFYKYQLNELFPSNKYNSDIFVIFFCFFVALRVLFLLFLIFYTKSCGPLLQIRRYIMVPRFKLYNFFFQKVQRQKSSSQQKKLSIVSNIMGLKEVVIPMGKGNILRVPIFCCTDHKQNRQIYLSFKKISK